jgi:hypothetical protein
MKIRILSMVLLALSWQVQAEFKVKETDLLHPASIKMVTLAPPVKLKPLPYITTQDIVPLLAQSYIVDSDVLALSPRITEQTHDGLVSIEGQEIIADKITEPLPRHYLVVKPGVNYRDPHSKEILGYGLNIVAYAELDKPGTPASLHLTKSYEEVQVGDKLMVDTRSKLPKRLTLIYPKGINGLVLGNVEHEKEAAHHELIIINQGKQDGLLPGAVLTILQPNFSQKTIGQVIVVCSYTHLSLALITAASRPIQALDKVVSQA